VIVRPDPGGCLAVLQSAHALMAFQMADHWGNRSTPRPSPRADVLAAVMLHDTGWDGREEPPRLAADGSPLAFDTLPEDEHEAVWSESVERAATRGNYVAHLVSHHVSYLATTYATTPRADFLAGEEGRRHRLRADLESDPTYATTLRTGADLVNRAVLRLTDAIAVLLAQGVEGRARLSDLPRRRGAAVLELEHVGVATYRLRPWPFVGRTLRVRAEARRLPRYRFADEASLRSAWEAADVVRLSWSLVAPGRRTG
jgi:hypothetical protein